MKKLFTVLSIILITALSVDAQRIVRMDDFTTGTRAAVSADAIYNVKSQTDTTSKVMWVGFNGEQENMIVKLTQSAVIDSINVDSTEAGIRGTSAIVYLFFANDSANVFNTSHIISARNKTSNSFMIYAPKGTAYQKVNLDFDVDSLETLLTPKAN